MAKRAMTNEAKSIKAQAILDKTEEMFSSSDYINIKMTDIAKEMGMSSGILFVYFKTKETLFFSLLCREYEKRLLRIAQTVKGFKINTYDDFKSLIMNELTDLIDNHRLYIRLEAIRSAILEKNIDTKTLLELKLNLHKKLKEITELICENKVLTQMEVSEIFQAQASIIVGCNLSASISDEIRAIIKENNMEDFQRDFRSDVLKTMKCYIEGYVGTQKI